jgi:hypothetical protein
MDLISKVFGFLLLVKVRQPGENKKGGQRSATSR